MASKATHSVLRLMEKIADIGHEERFQAEGSIGEYRTRLGEIFQRLGNRRPVVLIR